MNWPEPIYFRIGRGRDPQVYEDGHPFEFGKAIVHSRGSDLTLIACGIAVKAALDAAGIRQVVLEQMKK